MDHKWTNISASLPLSPYPPFCPRSNIAAVSLQMTFGQQHWPSEFLVWGGERVEAQRFWLPSSASPSSSGLQSPGERQGWVTGWEGEGDGALLLLSLHTSLTMLTCLAGWKQLICGVNQMQISVAFLGLNWFFLLLCFADRDRGIHVCVCSGKGKLTSWLNPKEWGGWQSLYVCWGLIWL